MMTTRENPTSRKKRLVKAYRRPMTLWSVEMRYRKNKPEPSYNAARHFVAHPLNAYDPVKGVRMTNRLVIAALAAFFALAASACKSNTTEEAASTAAVTESHEGHQMAKVYFKEPQDGATVPTLTKFVFGVDNY